MSKPKFKVGDKVRVFGTEEGVVTYGPVRSAFNTYELFVVKQDAGERAFKVSDLESAPETLVFTVGDTVTLTTRSGAVATVEYGPFDDRDVYVVRLVDEPADPDDVRTFTAMASVMRPALREIKVGDRVRVIRDDPRTKTGEFVGRTGTVRTVRDVDGTRRSLPYRVKLDDPSGTWDDDSWWVTEVELLDGPAADTVTHNGITYDLSACYRDRDGDMWRLKRVGDVVRARETAAGAAPTESSSSLANVVTTWGPLTRVTD
ncbi:phiSA1p31-related protein [Streptomyces sp. C10-9-1]|uniref:phiSA1p31-related protein n=1 Tax=Streptomyces sp. C10-9-1 TaxID=1859285 RepID=UPI002112995A|nr:phiSA1p31-related protein [Streptomyces sp. C10-9-1]MCQ6554755.1 phiSA1p31-related protein [Streptomyces sp. C10-9-1]